MAQNREAPDIYDEYLYINGWEKIGSTAVDLTNYYTKVEVDNLIPEVPTKVSELENDSGFITEYNETDPIYTADKPNIALKLEIPTKLSELTNDKGYITSYTETDPTVPSHVKAITETDITNWNNKAETSDIPDISTKQDTLVSGSNIKTINGESILGSGDITIEGGSGGSATKKAILRKLGLVLDKNTAFDMDILYNNGFNVNNGRIVLEAGKKYQIEIQVISFKGNTTASQLQFKSNIDSQSATIYSSGMSNQYGCSGRAITVFEPTEDIELTFSTNEWSSKITEGNVNCIVDELI